MNQDQINSIARALAAAKHEPFHPSYQAFTEETIQQWRDISASGVRLRPIAGTVTGSSADLFRECDNGVLTIATDGAPFAINHPLAKYLPEFGVTANTLFRAVHDYNGHYRTRAPFETFEGELTAYRNHRAMYSETARLALFGETIAQLCWYYSRGNFVAKQRCAIIQGAPIDL